MSTVFKMPLNNFTAHSLAKFKPLLIASNSACENV